MKGEILCHRKTGRMSSLKTICRITGIGTIPLMSSRTVITDRTAVSGVHARCCVLSLGDETDIGVADDGLTLTFVTAEGSTALRFEGSYAVIGKKRYETENLNLLETYLKTMTEGQALSSDENTL